MAKKRKRKSILKVAVSRIVGLIVFLIVLFLLNMLTFAVSFHLLDQVVIFLNTNLVLILFMSVVVGLGEIFGVMKFPYNLPAPLVNACGAVLIVAFIFQLMFFVFMLGHIPLVGLFRFLQYLIYPLVFIIVLIVGYVKIFLKN